MNNIFFNLTLGQIITIILCLLAFIILIQFIFLLKKAFPMMNKLNKILDDTSVITEVAADGAKVTKKTVSKINKTFFFQAEDGIRDLNVTGVQTCALPI